MKPTIILTHEADQKLTAYIKNVQNEVGGLGSIEISGNNILVTDIFLIEQQVTGATTNISQDGLAKFYQERKVANPADDFSSYKLWWHSHYNMSVFWSGTDDSTVDSFDQETELNNYMVSIVGNHAGERRGRVDFYKPLRLTVDELSIVKLEANNEFEAEIKKEIEAKVSTPKTVYVPYNFKRTDEDDNDIESPGLSKKQRKLLRKKEDKKFKTVQQTWYDTFGRSHSQQYTVPENGVIVNIDKTGHAVYWLKETGENDDDLMERYYKKVYPHWYD